MDFSYIDIAVFVIFIAGVVAIGLWKSREEKNTSEDYFLAGRGLKWWLIGFSLIAANISTEQFVGMSGDAAGGVGLAIASYEWMAAVTLVIVAFFFLPHFLRAGIYTMPEFLEYRYNWVARLIMAVATLGIYVVLVGSITYSGALTIETFVKARMGYEISLWAGSLFIVVIALIYVVTGGLKACAWADLIQGSALIIAGAIIMILVFIKLGLVNEATVLVDGAIKTVPLDSGMSAWDRFWHLNASKMTMYLPSDHPKLPWTALIVGLWIPNFYYWGLNQYITQRTLGAASLAEGQKGIVFSAFMKLLIPFIVVVPGIIAFNLYYQNMQEDGVFKSDMALGQLIANVIPSNGLFGFTLAALLGAVISSLAALLNAASTIFTMDIYKKYLNKDAEQKKIVSVGRMCVITFGVLAVVVSAFVLDSPKLNKGIFTVIQEVQGLISPGILAAFAFGFVVKKAPRICGAVSLLVNIVGYSVLKYAVPDLNFLNRMAVCFGLCLVTMTIIRLVKPMAEPITFESTTDLDLKSSKGAFIAGMIVIVLTVILYIVFSPLGVAK
ncbi:MAG: solute:sodium symporter family transporter [Planctomycetes bacterium]|nr:solute:sodium symporter family transporter [Planctomycetota bacterium]